MATQLDIKHALVTLFALKKWHEDLKERFSPPELHTLTFKIGEDNTIKDEQGQPVIDIKSKDTPDKILARINKAIANKQNEIDLLDSHIMTMRDLDREQKREWRERLDKAKAADYATTSTNDDVKAIIGYITAKAENMFPGNPPRIEYTPKNLGGRPEFKITWSHRKSQNYREFRNQMASVFGKENVPNTENTEMKLLFPNKISTYIEGNPAVLMGLIEKNDPTSPLPKPKKTRF